MGKEKPFYGKWIVFGSLMITTFAMAIINNTTAFYMTPICNELGFSTAAFSGCYSMSAVGAALGAILAGSLLKKIPIRVMMTIGAAGTALAFMGLSIANQLWQFYVLLLITDLCMAFITNVPLTTMINNWYIAKRGMMTGLVFAGAGLGSIVLSPLCEYLIQSMGWHATATVSGFIILVTALPVCLFIFRTAPEDMGQKPFTYPKGSPEALKEAAKGDTDTQSTADNKEGVPKKMATRSSAFGLLVLGLLCMGMVCSGVMVHIPNFLYALDMNAGFVISVLSIGMLIGTFANGIIVDKLGLIKDLLFVTILFILGILTLYHGIIGGIQRLYFYCRAANAHLQYLWNERLRCTIWSGLCTVLSWLRIGACRLWSCISDERRLFHGMDSLSVYRAGNVPVPNYGNQSW